MEYFLSAHARRRMAERLIPESLVEEALANPTKVGYDDKGRILVKKLYTLLGKKRLLLIAAEPKGNKLKIITVIDTSKIKKYL